MTNFRDLQGISARFFCVFALFKGVYRLSDGLNDHPVFRIVLLSHRLIHRHEIITSFFIVNDEIPHFAMERDRLMTVTLLRVRPRRT